MVLRKKSVDSYNGVMQVSERPIPVPEGMKQVFASYHMRAEDNSVAGYGNIVANFDPSQYALGKLDSFILELQRSIQLIQEERVGKKMNIQVLFFR